MSEKDTDRLLPDRERYRALAGRLREMALQAPPAYAREELLCVAASFEYGARHLGRYEG
jgi:hypothetical protein